MVVPHKHAFNVNIGMAKSFGPILPHYSNPTQCKGATCSPLQVHPHCCLFSDRLRSSLSDFVAYGGD